MYAIRSYYAFFSLCDKSGTLVFHTNPDLIGMPAGFPCFLPDFADRGFRERRMKLGTRITSYNVCYTKLLRLFTASAIR